MTPFELKSFREALSLSQAEFARAVGVESDRTVRKWEHGERDIPGPVAVLCSFAGAIPGVTEALIARSKGR